LSLSAFQFNKTMGLLSAVIIAVGGVVEFLLMPPMLLKLEEKAHEDSMVPTAVAAEPAPDAA
jgi:uncharacterized protein